MVPAERRIDVGRLEELEREGIGRRAFLRLLGVGVLALVPGQASARRTHRKKKRVYQLSSRDCRACKACKAHAANRLYRTQEAADADRAHVGCSCAIVSQRIERRLAKHYFKKRDAFDLRWEENA